MAETTHQSYLLITSREAPAQFEHGELHQTGAVRLLHLTGLDQNACDSLLSEYHLSGTPHERTRLAQAYAGNPLALQIVSELISELFGGEIAPFLAQNTAIFSSIRDLLTEQFSRLSATEHTLLIWLAIAREPLSLTDLHALLAPPIPETPLAEALLALQRRSLVERDMLHASFTLQSVVLEYVTEVLVEQVSQQILQDNLTSFTCYALEQARSKEYVRQAQERMIVTPILTYLQTLYRQTNTLEKQLLHLLNQLRGWPPEAQGYGPANLMMLLRALRGHLRGIDLSRLAIRGAYLQLVEMQDTTLAGALIQDCAFTETLDVTWSVAVSNHGRYWAAGSRRGEIRIWEKEGQTLHRVWQAHTDNTYALAFSPDERTLASGSWDRSVKLWDLETGTLLWTAWHANSCNCLAFAPDSHTLASSGDDATIRLWETATGTAIQAQTVPTGAVYSLAWSPDGKLLASSSKNGSLHLWQVQTPRSIHYIQTLTAHTNWVFGLAFAPDSTHLVNGSWDSSVKLWNIPNGQVCQSLTEHKGRVRTVAWSPDGRTIAYTGYDGVIWLWDVEQGCYRAVLHGHMGIVHSLTFTPDSHYLLSGGNDAILHIWDVTSGTCLRTVKGYSLSFYDIDWSPTGSHLASADTRGLVIIWDVSGRTPPQILHGHRWIVHGVAWSPNGQLLASSEWNNAIRLWNPATGQCLQILHNPDTVNTFFHGIAFSPDGHSLATSTYMEGIHVWDVLTGKRCWVGLPPTTKIRRVAWHPDGSQLASCGDDGSICFWNAPDGSLLQRLQEHQGMIAGVAWSPDGKLLASCGGGQEGRELLVWDVQYGGKHVQAFAGPTGVIWTVAWDPNGKHLVSGDGDGMLRWWERKRGVCMLVRQAHQGTVQALKVSPDGQTLASCGDDGAIMLWNLQTGEHLRTLRRDRPYERLDITGIEGLTQAQKSTLQALGAIEDPQAHSH